MIQTIMNEQNSLPKHWQVKKLGEVCDVLDNLRKPINSSERQQRISGKMQAELFPYYGATGQVGWIDDYITNNDYILIGEDGAPFLDHFKNKAYKITGKTWVNNHAHILKGKLVLDDFALYYLNSISYKDYVNGTTRLKLTKSSLVDIPFVLPPLSEQQAIVSQIEELLSELENGKQQLLTAQQQLKVYRQSLLKWAFEDDQLVKISISEVVEKIQIGPFGTQLHKDDYIQNGIPLINPTHIQDGVIVSDNSYTISSDKLESLPNYILKKGDVIMGRRGEMGRCGLVTEKENGWFCGTGSLYFRPDLNKVDSVFLYYYLCSKPVKKYLDENAGGTTMANLNLKVVKDIPISLPSLKEQQQIISELESKLTVCDKIEETISQGLQQAESLRQSILKMAFEGRLV